MSPGEAGSPLHPAVWLRSKHRPRVGGVGGGPSTPSGREVTGIRGLGLCSMLSLASLASAQSSVVVSSLPGGGVGGRGRRLRSGRTGLRPGQAGAQYLPSADRRPEGQPPRAEPPAPLTERHVPASPWAPSVKCQPRFQPRLPSPPASSGPRGLSCIAQTCQDILAAKAPYVSFFPSPGPFPPGSQSSTVHLLQEALPDVLPWVPYLLGFCIVGFCLSD